MAPDPILFSTVGLSPATATNPVGTDHTVTAFAQAANGAPVPGVTIDFLVLTGPNAGKTGTGTTGADGKTSFTYHDDGGAGTDTIQAFITAGAVTLASNIVSKIWGLACDVNNDGKVTSADLAVDSCQERPGRHRSDRPVRSEPRRQDQRGGRSVLPAQADPALMFDSRNPFQASDAWASEVLAEKRAALLLLMCPR